MINNVFFPESWAAERAVCCIPRPLEWGTPPTGCITPACLHNILTDGFYAPYAANPLYLLLIDCRDSQDYEKKRLMTAKWYGELSSGPQPENCITIVLYDDRPRTSSPPRNSYYPEHDDSLTQIYHEFKRRRLDPLIVAGGWPALEATCSNLMQFGYEVDHVAKPEIPWFPALIMPNFLYCGHAEMSSNTKILSVLQITHVISVSEDIPARVLPTMNYLVVPLPENDPVEDAEIGNLDINFGTDLASSLPTILAFVSEARTYGGSVLVTCDQGLTRAATVVMALLMTEYCCTLEDAFYYVKSARSAVHPHPGLLHQLANYEKTLFGTQLTLVEDLF